MITFNDNHRPPGPGFVLFILLAAICGWSAGFYGLGIFLGVLR